MSTSAGSRGTSPSQPKRSKFSIEVRTVKPFPKKEIEVAVDEAIKVAEVARRTADIAPWLGILKATMGTLITALEDVR
ncbi:12183_t:CDS:1, partial [Acaulospora colombiana]